MWKEGFVVRHCQPLVVRRLRQKTAWKVNKHCMYVCCWYFWCMCVWVGGMFCAHGCLYVLEERERECKFCVGSVCILRDSVFDPFDPFSFHRKSIYFSSCLLCRWKMSPTPSLWNYKESTEVRRHCFHWWQLYFWPLGRRISTTVF